MAYEAMFATITHNSHKDIIGFMEFTMIFIRDISLR
jgi:hypothetical protein